MTTGSSHLSPWMVTVFWAAEAVPAAKVAVIAAETASAMSFRSMVNVLLEGRPWCCSWLWFEVRRRADAFAESRWDGRPIPEGYERSRKRTDKGKPSDHPELSLQSVHFTVRFMGGRNPGLESMGRKEGGT